MKIFFISFYIIICLVTFFYQKGDLFINRIEHSKKIINTNNSILIDDCNIALDRALFLANNQYKACQIIERKSSLVISLFNESRCAPELSTFNAIKNQCIHFEQTSQYKKKSIISLPKKLNYSYSCKGIVKEIRWSTGSIITEPYLNVDIKCGKTIETNVPITISSL